MRSLILVLAAVALSGCASFKGQFANRAACTLDGKQMLVASMYGPIGIASKVAEEDARVVCAPAGAASAAK